MSYKIYTKRNLADTSRDPDDIVIEKLAYRNSLDEAKQYANDYIKEKFLGVQPLKEYKDGSYRATNFCSYGETIIIEKVNSINWVKLLDINNHDVEGKMLLLWQHNLVYKSSSRFQKGMYYTGNEKTGPFITIYPRTTGQIYYGNKLWVGSDLEGDKCQLTHFAFVDAPIDVYCGDDVRYQNK